MTRYPLWAFGYGLFSIACGCLGALNFGYHAWVLRPTMHQFLHLWLWLGVLIQGSVGFIGLAAVPGIMDTVEQKNEDKEAEKRQKGKERAEQKAQEERVEREKDKTFADGFVELAEILREDPVEFTKRPKVKAFLAHTGAQSTAEVMEYGFAEEFYNAFADDVPIIPREKARKRLGVKGPTEATAESTKDPAIETTVYGTPALTT